MTPIRQRVLACYPEAARGRAADEGLEVALYYLLSSVDAGVNFDGWTLFRVVRESAQAIEAVGLMSLLPGGAVPIAINVRESSGGFEWRMRMGDLDASWHALSSSKQWDRVYLYATGDAQSPPWAWGEERHGTIQMAPT